MDVLAQTGQAWLERSAGPLAGILVCVGDDAPQTLQSVTHLGEPVAQTTHLAQLHPQDVVGAGGMRRPRASSAWKASIDRLFNSPARCSRISATRSTISSQSKVNTSRLDLGASWLEANLPTTASKDGSGMKRTVIRRSVDSTKPKGGVVWAPAG